MSNSIWIALSAVVAALNIGSTAAYAGKVWSTGYSNLYREGASLVLTTNEGTEERLGLEPIATPPGLSFLWEATRRMPLAGEFQEKIVAATAPTHARRYFRIVGDESVDKENLARLIAARNEIGLKPASGGGLLLRDGNDVLLFNGFMSLSPSRQAAALFGGAVLGVSSATMYFQVTALVAESEQALGAYLEKSDPKRYRFDPGLFDILDRVFETRALSLNAAAMQDSRDGILKPLLNSFNRIPLNRLIGEAGLKRVVSRIPMEADESGIMPALCLYGCPNVEYLTVDKKNALVHAVAQSARYPRSVFLAQFAKQIPFLREMISLDHFQDGPMPSYYSSRAKDYGFAPWIFEDRTFPDGEFHSFPVFLTGSGRQLLRIIFRAPGEQSAAENERDARDEYTEALMGPN